MSDAQEPATVSWNGRRVLVTGVTGLIGSWLTKELLEQGAHVTGLVLDADPRSELWRSGDVGRITIVNGRLEDFATVERAINVHEVDTVFHLGAQTQVGAAERSPLQTFEANIRGTYNVLEACRVHRGLVQRVVVASSDKAYGTQPTLPYVETMPLLGVQPYEVSKSCADLIAQSYHRTYGVPVAIARCANVYGGGDLNWTRLVPGTIRSFLKGERPIIRSDGTYQRDYIYVKDVAGAYLTLAAGVGRADVQGEAFNFGTERHHAVLDVVGSIQCIMSCEHIEPEILGTARHEIRDQHLSAAKAHERLEWRQRFDLAAGLPETVAWYRNAFDARVFQ